MIHKDVTRTTSLDAVVVGAGFAGLYMLHRLRSNGFRTQVVEAGSNVGGTWFWNRYPGARCDVESLQYSYSFSEELQQDWTWTERFATQPEILRYANHVADRFDLRRDIRFDTKISDASWDEAAQRWTLSAEDGSRFQARFAIMATGALSAGRLPDIPGIADFAGDTWHTGNWPHEGVDFSGRTVAVIGTGSSGIQAIPEIAKQAGHLTVFQRTPSFTIPARNRPLSPEEIAHWKADYPAKRRRAREETPTGTIYDFATQSAHAVSADEREAEYRARWSKGGANFMHAFNDLLLDADANRTAADFVRARIAEIVTDPETAAALTPTQFPIATKRICVDTDYFETFNRPNVTLVNLRKDPITRITAEGVETASGLHRVDGIVFATGFDALTGALDRIAIRAGGTTLKDKWSGGPRAYLGLMSAGFPNLFLVTGPGSPSVLSNVIVSIEQHVEWIADCLEYMRDRNMCRIDADAAAEDEWVEHVNEVAAATLYLQADSWYLGANVPGKPRVFMPYIGVAAYRRKCDAVAAAGYAGFHLDVEAGSVEQSRALS